ncbi:SusC/RagA family TonB-linked outer membrane protein [Sphingobacterium multivorum]|uniref:SusC/RagA family TonB-linked outer membrane protein n=1 Tax=Sphingobacterium multivorum TaxID=28454 RepID=UPI0028ABE663|nr:SusC/RagA family TonB-linked outer membrane protein [Sphingobacterium multivorum]
MKITLILVLLLSIIQVQGQQVITGTIRNNVTNLPIENASVSQSSLKSQTKTDKNGHFIIKVNSKNDSLMISHVGFKSLRIADVKNNAVYFLIPTENILQEVEVSTGFQKVPKERATGSFTFINRDLLGRKISSNILTKLEGVTNSLSFDRRSVRNSDDPPSLRVRGLSTMYANTQPLIILDNFPYEGDIQSINPNDIENVTILKDAAAASIWGARAANGVIVITTRNRNGTASNNVSFTSAFSIQDRPDLHYSKSWLASKDFLELEDTFFDRGFYNSVEKNANMNILSPYVQDRIDLRNGKITKEDLEKFREKFSQNDLLKDANDYLYQKGSFQQYAIALDGRYAEGNYYLSLGYDKNNKDIKGNGSDRYTLNLRNQYKISRILDITAQLLISDLKNRNNGLGMLGLGTKLYPYARLKDELGNNLDIERDFRTSYKIQQESLGLLDWRFRPLDEPSLRDITNSLTQYQLNLATIFHIIHGIDLDIKGQYGQTYGKDHTYYSKDSYYTRDMINRYTQPNGERPIPIGGINYGSNSKEQFYSIRPQLNINKQINGNDQLNVLLGSEIRQVKSRSGSNTLYGYDPEINIGQSNLDFSSRFNIRPRGSQYIPAPDNYIHETIDRYLSYFGNISYNHHNKYIISLSSRWDASNLFGVLTNQRGVPLWSVGASWLLSDEKFYPFKGMPYLRLRTTYGINGNIDKTVTAFPTMRIGTDSENGFPFGTITNPGNPLLRWEKVALTNFGIDFKTKGNRITGSLEYYSKYCKDLFGFTTIDPTLYFSSAVTGMYRVNYADMKASGIDIEVTSTNIISTVFNWQTDFLFSKVKNKVTNYLPDGRVSTDAYVRGNFTAPIENRPLDILFSYPDYKLDPTTGDPIVTIDGNDTKNYADFRNKLTVSDLKYHGQSTPTIFGSIRNTFTFREFTLGFNVQYKLGYYFRRPTMNYYNFLNSMSGHQDFLLRWTKPGDELLTNIPSVPKSVDANRDLIVGFSSYFVEKGDHIRLRDINFSYRLPLISKYIKQAKIYGNIDNMGILWKSSKYKIDPV